MSLDLNPGDQVGDYRVEGLLGRGGAAIVYRAAGPGGEAVALKLILPELAVEKTFRQRFELEVSIAQRVSHPNVVSVLDNGEYDGIPWLTQRLVTGGSLRELFNRGDSLSVEQSLKLTEEVAAGLDAAHAAGLVHRDVKPANILLNEDGTACITDFGLVRDTGNEARLTRPGQTLGSMNYMAPEQVRGDDVGPFTDIYALGCMLYECVCGIPPFGDRPGMGVLLAQLEGVPVHPSERKPELPRELGDAILLALAKDAAARPATASGYAEAVRAAATLPA